MPVDRREPELTEEAATGSDSWSGPARLAGRDRLILLGFVVAFIITTL